MINPDYRLKPPNWIFALCRVFFLLVVPRSISVLDETDRGVRAGGSWHTMSFPLRKNFAVADGYGQLFE